MTNRLEIFERAEVRSSVSPSLKYSCLGSSLMLTNGSTTMEGLSGNGSAGCTSVLSTESLTEQIAPGHNSANNERQPCHHCHHPVGSAHPTEELQTLRWCGL